MGNTFTIEIIACTLREAEWDKIPALFYFIMGLLDFA